MPALRNRQMVTGRAHDNMLVGCYPLLDWSEDRRPTVISTRRITVRECLDAACHVMEARRVPSGGWKARIEGFVGWKWANRLGNVKRHCILEFAALAGIPKSSVRAYIEHHPTAIARVRVTQSSARHSPLDRERWARQDASRGKPLPWIGTGGHGAYVDDGNGPAAYISYDGHRI